MSKTRVAVIGAGALANAMHHPSLHEFADVEVVGLCDLVPDKLAATAAKYAIPHTYSDYKAMVKEQDPDAVYVITPPQHLYEPVSYVLGAKKHVFIEKPPALTLTQIRNLAKKADQAGVLSMVGFNRRHTPLVVECKQRVEERGPIELAAVTFYKNYFAGEYYDGMVDILTCDAIHALDLVRWLSGGECVKLSSSVRMTGGEDYPNSWQALMEFSTGCTGLLLAHWTAGKRFHHAEFHAKGITCYTEFEKSADVWADGAAEPVHLEAAEVTGASEGHKTFGFFAENRYFIDCIQSGTQPSSHFGDAVKTMELVARIYQGA
ncbi:MAG: Gfo/Idh/MocA family oxidoreductase [Fimbriimonadaceae bacterium]|nr:Gfo/Idh/MocA family oxidoreductase [Fimbriimonadaceae bacterium]